MARHEQFRLPDVGEGLTEGEILRWFVAVGDTVVVNQTIVEIETAKAAVELPSPVRRAGHRPARRGGRDGRRRHARSSRSTPQPGSPRRRGARGRAAPPVVAEPTPTGGCGAGAPSSPPTEFVPTPKPEREAVLVGYGVMSASASRRPRRPAGGSTHPVQPTRHGGLEVGRAVERALVDAPSGPAPARAKPPVRKLAKDLGVDLTSVPASGPGGTVTRGDVESLRRRSAVVGVGSRRWSCPVPSVASGASRSRAYAS